MKRNKIKSWSKEAKYKLQSDCRRTKFSIPIVDHCSMIQENNTCVRMKTARTHTCTHARIPISFVIDICFLLLLCAAITLMCLFCLCVFLCMCIHFKRRMVVFALQKCVLIYGFKTFGTFHLRAQTTKPKHFLFHHFASFYNPMNRSYFLFNSYYRYRWYCRVAFPFDRSLSNCCISSLNIWSLMPVSVLFRFNKPSIWPVSSRARSLTPTKQINHHVWFTLLHKPKKQLIDHSSNFWLSSLFIYLLCECVCAVHYKMHF